MYSAFLENLVNLNLQQMVLCPTRGNNILDLFLTNFSSQVHETNTLPPLSSSDHDIVHHEIKVNRGRSHQPKREIRCYNKANWLGLKQDLLKFSKAYMDSKHTDPNTAWTCFKDELNRLCSVHIPIKTTKTRRDLPMVNQSIIRLIRKRDHLYKQIKRSSSPSQNLVKEFKKLKYKIQKDIRNSYWQYLESVIFTQDSQPGKNKKFYTYVKYRKTENCDVAPLKHEGQTFTDPTEKANILNKQFESVFSSPLPLSLAQSCRQKLIPTSRPSMPEINITEDGVNKLLRGLNPNKASGPDQISPRLLMELHTEVTPILTNIFQLSITTGIVPNDWRHAIIAPVYKKGQKSKPSNYRPISLTCIASKLIEHIIVSNIMSFYDENNLLSQYQHGFRSKHSCETQIISFTQEVHDNLEQGQQTDVIVMDFSKAFDKVDHHKLISKLYRLGINDGVIAWIQSFLCSRSQRVVVEGRESDSLPVLSGVPQGSVLGPCLFLSYINDLPDGIGSGVRLFADDTIVYLTIKTTNDSLKLQNDLHKLEKWEKDWSMEFNAEKCEILRITRKRNPVIYPYKLHDQQLKSTTSTKYLGVTISQDLSWTKHINNVTKTANNSLRFLKRNIKTSNKKIKETAYKTYVRPQVEYCSSIWSPWQAYLNKRVEQVQRSAARYVYNDYLHTNSVTQMISQLNWQTLEQRRKIIAVTYLYKIQHNLVYIDHLHLTTTRNLNFLIPYSRTQYHANSFFPRTIRLWNRLPLSTQSSPSLEIYAGRLDPFFKF